MGKLIRIIAFTQFLPLLINGQNTSVSENKFKIRSLEVGSGFYHSGSEVRTRGDESFQQIESKEYGGISGFLEVSSVYKKHIFTVGMSGGRQFILWGGETEGFALVNLFYGRAFDINSWFSIQLDGGLAMLSYKRLLFFEEGTTRKTTLGVPLRVKLLIKTSERVSLGIQAGTVFNSIDTIHTGDLILRYKLD